MKIILVVEDEFTIADVLRELLQDEGYRVEIADNGQQALECLRLFRPDLVLLDIMMPVLDGRALCRAMYEHPAWRSIPIVVMSAGYQPPGIDDCIDDCHYVAFLGKPFSLSDVLAIVRQFVGSASRA